jgi:23S rRNA pseudouridine1911/1915/1917 synthase
VVSGEPIRLDRFLAAHGPVAGHGRREIAALIARGAARVNGRPGRKGTMVRAGDAITVHAERSTALADMAPMALRLLRVDAMLVAVDKPPSLPTTIGRAPGPSLAGALLARFPEMAAIGDPRHAGLVHRLDTGTSGVLLAARTVAAHARLRAAFRRKAIRKDYLAVVVGRLEGPSTVTRALARRRRGGWRMVAAHGSAKSWPATTEIVPIGGDDALTVVRLQMRTGVTHQLRVHLAGIGHPIVGDQRYGGQVALPSTLEVPAPPWHFLHAFRIACDDADLPAAIATPFPAHWAPLFAARGWPTTID